MPHCGRWPTALSLTDDLRRANRNGRSTKRHASWTKCLAIPRVLPDVAFRDELTFWRGAREFRLFSMTGDATRSAVLYLPAEKILVTGDVLVSPPDGQGPPPWTTNWYAIAPWLASLRRLETFDAHVIVPGQGPVDARQDLPGTDRPVVRRHHRRGAACPRTRHLQGRRRRGGGEPGRDRQAVSPGADDPDTPFGTVVARLVRKAAQEALDGIVK